MAIWPFGRKSKRHTIQLGAAEATAVHSSLEPHPEMTETEPKLGHKSSREQSRHQSSRLSQRTGGAPGSWRASAFASYRPVSTPDHLASDVDHERSEHESPHPSRMERAHNDVSHRPLSQTGSLLRHKPSQTGPNKLRRRLSKRKANEIMREREIRMLSSTPIDIPRRSTPLGAESLVENRRRRGNGRRSDRYLSDISLSMRDSATSSMSDASDPYTFKVNAFAALTPRPIVRYVEAPRMPSARTHTASAASTRQDKETLQALTMSEENLYYSKRRVNELADSLDAGALRELLERDRRRRDKKHLEDQEKLQRKLRERAEAQEAKERTRILQEAQQTKEEPDAGQRDLDTQDHAEHVDDSSQAEYSIPGAFPEQSDSWLQGESKGSEVVAGRGSLESVRVIGNIDDSSVRDHKLAPRPSFAPSHEMATSRTTLSPSHSSLRQELGSRSPSQTFGPGSTSDISRLAESERRPSDTSGRRGHTFSSLFRRGSSRLKRRYRERFHDSSPEISNASHDSFFRVQTQSSPPPSAAAIVVPPRPFVAVKHSQSKFTEIFGDEPLSPPESRLQSPEIPEEVPESSLEREVSFLQDPAPSSSVEIKNPKRARHRSGTGESFDAEADNMPLSQSLASIDSEGSWMSGQFFRRFSQKPSSPVRASMSSFRPTPVDGAADVRSGAEGIADDETQEAGSRPLSSDVMGELELENELPGAAEGDKPAEKWHSEVGKRPVVVNPTVRPKSTQGMLKNIPALSPISAEEDSSLVDEPALELQRATSVEAELGHVEETDAGEPGTAI